MSDRGGSDSDAPEEFTAEEGLRLEHELRKIQKENKERVKREGKERRKKWADRITPRPSRAEEVIQDEESKASEEEAANNQGMLPMEIVNLLAAREKQVFSSDSEDEENAERKRQRRKKRVKKNEPEPIILNNLPPPQCVQNSLDFLKKRKMQVPRSNAVLNNSNQALRLLSSSGMLK
uniref:Uncharacterized protein n=1 Tax=Kalanchoe fedtschenkoi TaxID=63787 RepID=A0A7N0UC13_KALFE